MNSALQGERIDAERWVRIHSHESEAVGANLFALVLIGVAE